MPSKLLAKRIITWLAFILGLLICVCGLALFGSLKPPPYYDFIDWAILLGAVFMGLGSLIASLLVMRNRRAVFLIYTVSAVIEAGCTLSIRLSKYNRLYPSVLQDTGGASVLFVLLSIFWYISQRQDWPYLFAPGHPSWWRKSAAIITGLLMLLIISLGSIRLGVTDSAIDCTGPPPFARPMAPDQAVFTAEVRGTSAWPLRMVGIDYLPYGVVKEYFWGLHWWERKFVLLTLRLPQNVFFIDGRAMRGFLTRFLPVVELMPCTRTNSLDQATEDMRVLHDGPPRTGVRIIGTVIHTHSKPNAPREAVEMEVTITGPAGPIKIKTDKQGIYDVSGLPPGAYSAVVTEEGAILRGDNNCRTYPDQDLKSGDIWGCRLLIR